MSWRRKPEHARRPASSGESAILEAPPRDALAPALALLGGVAVMATTWIAADRLNLPLESFTEDPTRWLHGASYTGAVSFVGVLAWWWAAAAACTGGLALLALGRQQAGFLLAAGMLSALLALDDLFQLHERALPAITALPELAAIIGYVALGAALTIRFRRELRDAGAVTFALVMALLGLSAAADLAQLAPRSAFWLEDGSKLTAALVWAVFLARQTVRALGAEARPTPPAC